MNDLPIIKSKCEKVLREIDHSGNKARRDNALYDLYKHLFNHFYQPPPLGVTTAEEVKTKDKTG